MHIPTYLDIFRQNQAHSEIIQAYPGPSVNLKYLDPWHLEHHRHIQNPGIFRILGVFRYIQNHWRFENLSQQPCQTSTFFEKIVNAYNYFGK